MSSSKVMLIVNVDVCEGSVNGARGLVSEIIKKNDKVLTILVKFYDAAIGRVIIQTSSYKLKYLASVLILRHTVNFTIKGIRGAEVTRKQHPTWKGEVYAWNCAVICN